MSNYMRSRKTLSSVADAYREMYATPNEDILNEELIDSLIEDVRDEEINDWLDYLEEDGMMSVPMKNKKKIQQALISKYAKKHPKVKITFGTQSKGKFVDDNNVNFKGNDKDIDNLMKDIQKDKPLMKMMEDNDLDESKGLAAKAKKSGISVGTLRKVYNRGMAAWKTGHRPGTTPQQWGMARVNAFIVKKKKGNLNHDKDLAHVIHPDDSMLDEAHSKYDANILKSVADTYASMQNYGLQGDIVEDLQEGQTYKSIIQGLEKDKKEVAKKSKAFRQNDTKYIDKAIKFLKMLEKEGIPAGQISQVDFVTNRVPKFFIGPANKSPSLSKFTPNDVKKAVAHAKKLGIIKESVNTESLWRNIHNKRKRGEKMRKPGEKGAPKPGDFERARGEAVSPAQQAAIAISKKERGEKPKNECADEKDFKPHMMYDPKTGKGVMANKYADHVKYDKMGYTHEKPKSEALDAKDKPFVKDLIKKLRGGSKTHAKQADDLEKAMNTENRAKRDAMRDMGSPKDKEDDGYGTATDDDRKAADKNVIMQIRRVADLPKGGQIELPSGKKVKMDRKSAIALNKKFDSIRKPQDKLKLQKMMNDKKISVVALKRLLGK